ncbi:MAG: hypothetical protein V1862_08510 [Methanobacteriota archaeon]
MNLDTYLSGYLDRRMNLIVEEWQIATKGELADLTQRLHRVQEDLTDLKNFERESADRLSDLEERVQKIREEQK